VGRGRYQIIGLRVSNVSQRPQVVVGERLVVSLIRLVGHLVLLQSVDVLGKIFEFLPKVLSLLRGHLSGLSEQKQVSTISLSCSAQS